MEIVIVTDSCCDLPYHYVSEHLIDVLPLTVTIDEEITKDEIKEDGNQEYFYKRMLEGVIPTTSQVNAYTFKEAFLKHIKEGKAVVYIGFSSALSGCINSAMIAKQEIQEEIPEASIHIIDSKCASMGQGLLIYYAIEELKKGIPLTQLIEFIEQTKLKVCHWFTVSDLNFLFKGGRVSKTAAVVGTLLQIKPILHVDDEGRLIPMEKVKGRKKSLQRLVEKVKSQIVKPQEQIVFISHGACLKEAEEVKKTLIEECGVKDVWINYVGIAVGSHSGPGTVAIFFLGEHR